MNTRLSIKFTALAVSLMINSLMIGVIAYLFSGQLREHAATASAFVRGAPATVLVPASSPGWMI